MDQGLFLGIFGVECSTVGCTVSDYNAHTPICAVYHSLNHFFFLHGAKQMRSIFFDRHLMICIAGQYVIQGTALHKNITSQLQIILKS
jgi:hypothetical protein